MVFKCAVVSCLLGCILQVAHAHEPIKTLGLGLPPLESDAPLPEALFISQKLDHFAAQTVQWNQRYFVNSQFWDGSGPIFLMLGGEGAASPSYITADTQLVLMAKKYHAMIFLVEHRYYGDSHPTPDTSVHNLQYLTSRQALADFQHFITAMIQSRHLKPTNKWVVFGCSYAGALASWFRQVYPSATVGAVASSAPVEAIVDFKGYIEVMAASLGASSHGRACVDGFTQAFSSVSAMLKDRSQWPTLQRMFHISPPISSDMDVETVMSNFVGIFGNIIQYNRESFGEPTIESICSIMSDGSRGTPLQRLQILMLGKSIYPVYTGYIAAYKQDGWNTRFVREGARQWFYQTCTEFGYFMTTNSDKTSIFSHLLGLNYYTGICQAVFGIPLANISKNVKATNDYYGGKSVKGSKIIFPNGSTDPWHALGVTSDIGSSIKAVYIDKTAHCADIMPAARNDYQSLKDARVKISNLVGTFLQ